MITRTFNRVKIQQELQKLTKKQILHFAWLCAVRALPFLGANANFKFWKENERQKHLYAIFYALDISATADYSDLLTAAATDASSAAYAASTYAADYFDSAYSDSAASASFATSAALHSFAAANTANAAGDTDYFYAANDSSYAADSAYAAASKKKINLPPIILQDLKNIQSDNGEIQSNQSELYGKIWDNFQKALESEGCAYWGRLYQSIFDDGFVLDTNALEQRLNVPEEIRDQGASVVANYLEELEKGAERLNEARIIILGDKGSGKTCLARRLVDPAAPMTTDDESTAGVETTLWKLNGEDINVHIWDFAGHTVTHAVHQFFLSERCLYIMLYDGRTEERNRLEYWLDHMKNYGGGSKAIILVNKRDQHSVDIPINSLKEQYPIEGVYTFSIQDDIPELEAFRKVVAAYIKNNPSWNQQVIPSNYYKVKEELEGLFVRGEKNRCLEHITKDIFDKIAKKNIIGNIEKLLTSLHKLGICLWYKDMEDYDTLVLNPEWISQGVYKIINWVNEEKKYYLTITDFAKVFEDDAARYPKDKHKFLFELMKHYELAYETEKENSLIIPHLLKEDRPIILPDFNVGEGLMLRYKAEQPLPPNTISRFIVRHNQEIKKEEGTFFVWRYGVVLEESNGTIALVREENLTISVSVKGSDKTNYIGILRQTLNDIFNSYKSKKPELQYRIERFGQIPDEVEANNPLWLPDKKIFNHTIDKVPYYDDNTRQLIDLQKTVSIYNINGSNLIVGGQGNQLLDKSTHNTFNFYDCNIGLQGNLNELALALKNTGNKEAAKELETAVLALEQAEKCQTKDEVKKKGIANTLKRLVEDLCDDDSKLHKTVEGIKNGISIAQDIAKGYNDIAQWVGLPQVPKPFLKK